MPALPENPWASRTYDALLSEMLALVPATMDKSVGSFVYDAIAPVAAVMADAFTKADLLRQAAFVDTAVGSYLDGHVEAHGLSRRLAVQALGTIRLTGTQALVVAAGSQFSTLADPNSLRGPIIFYSPTIAQVQPRAGNGTFGETDPSIVYTGVWSILTNGGFTYKQDATNNDTAKIYFNGTAIDIHLISFTDRGIAAISVDGGAETTHDLYNVAYTDITVTKSGLAAGNHTVQIRVTNTKNGSSSSYYIALDRFVVTGAQVTITDFIDIPVTALVGGINGNLGSGTIVRLVSPISGVVSVTNLNATAGGLDLETDDELRLRFKTYISNPPASGNKADYIRWAKEASVLVGAADCLPIWAGAGTVKVFVLDTSNNPASAPILATVQAYIDPTPAGTGSGKAPVGATVTVVAPTAVPIDIKVTIVLMAGFDLATVQTAITKNINTYIQSLGIADTIRFSGLANAVHDTSGISDYSALTFRRDAVAYAATNIVLAAGEKAVLRLMEFV